MKTNVSTRDQHSFLKALGRDWFLCLLQLLVATHIPWLTSLLCFKANSNRRLADTVSLLLLMLPVLPCTFGDLLVHTAHLPQAVGGTSLVVPLLGRGSVSPSALMSATGLYKEI